MINDSNKLQIVTKIESWWTDFYNVHDVKFSLFETFHSIFPQWFKRETKLKEIRSVWINGVRIYQIIDTEAVLVKLWTAVIIKTKTNKSTCYTCMYSGCSLLSAHTEFSYQKHFVLTTLTIQACIIKRGSYHNILRAILFSMWLLRNFQ